MLQDQPVRTHSGQATRFPWRAYEALRGRHQDGPPGLIADIAQRALTRRAASVGLWLSQDPVAPARKGMTDTPKPMRCRPALPLTMGQRVVVEHQPFQPIIEDVGVDLGRGDVGMAQQHLDRAQVGAIVQQMRGKGMAQRVGGNAVGVQPRDDRQLLDQGEKPDARQMSRLPA